MRTKKFYFYPQLSRGVVASFSEENEQQNEIAVSAARRDSNVLVYALADDSLSDSICNIWHIRLED